MPPVTPRVSRSSDAPKRRVDLRAHRSESRPEFIRGNAEDLDLVELHDCFATAELVKVAANSFLATKISFINEIAMLADKVGAVEQVGYGAAQLDEGDVDESHEGELSLADDQGGVPGRSIRLPLPLQMGLAKPEVTAIDASTGPEKVRILYLQRRVQVGPAQRRPLVERGQGCRHPILGHRRRGFLHLVHERRAEPDELIQVFAMLSGESP